MGRPNILFITTDQQRFDTIRTAADNKEIYTPHLDWLAAEGVLFTNHYADCPVCMPSRSTMLTGKSACSMGIYDNRDIAAQLVHHGTFPRILTAAGYQTKSVGKMHFEPMRCHYGLESMELSADYYREMRRKGGSQPRQHGLGENEMVPGISTVSEEESQTHWVIERSINFLETRDETRPFFLWTSFPKPHPPLDPCRNYWELYANKELSGPTYGSWSRNADDVPKGFLRFTAALNGVHRFGAQDLMDMKRAYYACITQIDYQLGLLFARMREMNLFEDTWIIFTSDHGEMLGDHHMGAKQVFFDASARVPLIVRPADGDSRRTSFLETRRSSRVTQMADVAPTFLDLAGLKAPEDMEGVSLLDLPVEDRTVYGACARDQHMVLREGIKILYTANGGDKLMFDLKKDPMETRNIYDNPSYSETREEMDALLIGFLKEQNIGTQPGIDDLEGIMKWPCFNSIEAENDIRH